MVSLTNLGNFSGVWHLLHRTLAPHSVDWATTRTKITSRRTCLSCWPNVVRPTSPVQLNFSVWNDEMNELHWWNRFKIYYLKLIFFWWNDLIGNSVNDLNWMNERRVEDLKLKIRVKFHEIGYIEGVRFDWIGGSRRINCRLAFWLKMWKAKIDRVTKTMVR